MTFAENTHHDVWNRLGPAKYLAGRKRVRRLVERAVAEWPGTIIAYGDKTDISLVCDGLSRSIAEDEFGSILVMVFIGLASAIVQVLLEWWLLGTAYRRDFCAWQQELLA